MPPRLRRGLGVGPQPIRYALVAGRGSIPFAPAASRTTITATTGSFSTFTGIFGGGEEQIRIE